MADPENFGGGGIIKILSTKPQKFGCLHRNWDWFFENSNVFSAQNQVVSKKIKIKKKVFTEIETDFSEIQTFFPPKIRWSQKKKKKKKVETDFSAEIVRFRLVGGMHPPSKSATVSVPTLLFAKNMKAKMTIFMAQPLFSWVRLYSFWNEGFFRIDVTSKFFKPVFVRTKTLSLIWKNLSALRLNFLPF